MAGSLTEYYQNAKEGMGAIDPVEATQLMEDVAIAGATGATIGLLSAALDGNLDATIGGMKIPLDGLLAFGLGGLGLTTKSPELKVAAIAAVGSASTRIFVGMFGKGVAAHGDFDDPALSAMGWGAEQKDQLIEAAKHL